MVNSADTLVLGREGGLLGAGVGTGSGPGVGVGGWAKACSECNGAGSSLMPPSVVDGKPID